VKNTVFGYVYAPKTADTMPKIQLMSNFYKTTNIKILYKYKIFKNIQNKKNIAQTYTRLSSVSINFCARNRDAESLFSV